jgi:hypothetical protein
MRLLASVTLWAALSAPVTANEQVGVRLEWGFGPASSELYWDGEIQCIDGTLVSINAVSFEADRHDRLTAPTFQSLTVNNGTDGAELVLAGTDRTLIRIQSKQGTFQWTLAELRERGELAFRSQDQGKLVVRLVETLGDAPALLSTKLTQDSDPAICRMKDGHQLVLWRAFLGLPERDSSSAKGGDQIHGLVLNADGKTVVSFDVLQTPADVETICVAPLADGRCLAVWAERQAENWDLFCSTLSLANDRVDCTPPLRLTDNPGVDRCPSLAVGPDGSLLLAWQGWRETHSRVFVQECRLGQWGTAQCLSDGTTNDWDPAIAAAVDNSVAVAWTRWWNGSYDVCLKIRDQGSWSPLQAVAATDRFEAHPSLAHTGDGTLWIAYEEGQPQWGMDSHNAGLRSGRNVRLRCWRNGRLADPTNSAALTLPAEFLDASEMALLQTDGARSLWLFFRSLQRRGVWEVFGTSLGDDWSPPQRLVNSAGGQNIRTAIAPAASGRLRVVWCADHRVDPVGKDSWIYTSLMPARPRRAQPIESQPLQVEIASATARRDVARPVLDFTGRQYGLYFGDLHRHTELSVCVTGKDGSLEDAYRYAIDAAGLDFLCVTDHVQHVKILNDYDFWRTGKTADLHRVPGVHQPFYGYERSQRFPLGHRNIISLRRDVRRVPRTQDNRPWDANTSYPGEQLIPPPEFWARLVGENAITIPHTSTSPVMGTDFAFAPGSIEPVIEIYQGCRYTGEYADAPDPRAKREGDKYGGATQSAGFIWNALAKGYRYGFIASSDHVATHNSYTCVWSDSFTNAAILDAMAKRRCYAATDRIECRMHMGPHLMGSEFTAANVPPLEVAVVGTTHIERVDVVKDNRVVYTHTPASPTTQVQFQFQDLQVEPGIHYYYARAIQTDRNMAWISPIWVEVPRAAPAPTNAKEEG